MICLMPQDLFAVITGVDVRPTVLLVFATVFLLVSSPSPLHSGKCALIARYTG